MNNLYKIILYFLFIVLLSTCSEENATESNVNLYKGTWLWVKTVGGIFPKVTVPEGGTTLKINFSNWNIYTIHRNDSLKVSANYQIEEIENDWDKISFSNIITYNYNFNTNIEFAKMHSDTLTIWDGMIDGYFSFYKKLP